MRPGVRQYEISNFARAGQESRHNLKYWTRQPYLGFGVDAHSMLTLLRKARTRRCGSASPDSLEEYVAARAAQGDARVVTSRAGGNFLSRITLEPRAWI